MVELDEPPHLAGRSPGRAALERAGLAQVLLEVRRDLALPVAPAHLDALEAACAPHADGYVVRTWRDRCPDDLVDDRAALGAVISTDAPLGDLAWEEEVWDAARVRRREESLVRMGRTFLAGGAVHVASGQLVAFTEAVAPVTGEALVHQWETVVLREHRGHRLGTLVKTAVLRRLADELPHLRTMATTNADSNGPMIAVNEALGYRPNGTLTEWQRTL
jgi:RimJ/RimL family protein N-acetyltransferase